MEIPLGNFVAMMVTPIIVLFIGMYVWLACRTPTGGFCFHRWEYPLAPDSTGIRRCRKCTSKQYFEGSCGMIETGLVWVWADNKEYEKQLKERGMRVQAKKAYQGSRVWYG